MNATTPHSSKTFSRLKREGGFTLLESVIAIGIIIVIIGIAVPAINTARYDSTKGQADANSKVINEAIQRAYLKGDTNPLIYGPDANNVEAAASYLQTQGYLR